MHGIDWRAVESAKQNERNIIKPKRWYWTGKISPDLIKYLESIPPVTDADLEALRKAARDLDNDPEFLAELARDIEKERELNNDSTTTS